MSFLVFREPPRGTTYEDLSPGLGRVQIGSRWREVSLVPKREVRQSELRERQLLAMEKLQATASRRADWTRSPVPLAVSFFLREGSTKFLFCGVLLKKTRPEKIG